MAKSATPTKTKRPAASTAARVATKKAAVKTARTKKAPVENKAMGHRGGKKPAGATA